MLEIFLDVPVSGHVEKHDPELCWNKFEKVFPNAGGDNNPAARAAIGWPRLLLPRMSPDCGPQGRSSAAHAQEANKRRHFS